MFSRSCEYALQAILYITIHSDKNKAVGLKQIAQQQKIPLHYLSKILQQLVKQKVLISIKGPNGGFKLSKPSSKFKLIQIVEIVDGTDIFDRCGIGLKKCSDKNPCPIHFSFKEIKNTIRQILEEKTLSQLAKDVHEGNSIVTFK